MKQKNVLFILSGGRVAAINKKDGAIIWEIRLKDHGFKSMAQSIGQIMEEDGKLYIGCAGVMLCLNAKDGAFVWMNELKGWGFGFVSIAGLNNDAAGATVANAAATSAVISASS